MKNNYERIKNVEDVYEMADIIGGFVANNKSELFDERTGQFYGLYLLDWLKSDRNIFNRDREIKNKTTDTEKSK